MNHMFDMIEGTQVATKAPQKWLPCPICPTQCPNWPNCNVTKAIEYSGLYINTQYKVKTITIKRCRRIYNLF